MNTNGQWTSRARRATQTLTVASVGRHVRVGADHRVPSIISKADFVAVVRRGSSRGIKDLLEVE